MKVYVIVTIGRQVNGDYCVPRVDAAYLDKTRAEQEYAKMLPNPIEKIPAPWGGTIECWCMRTIHELEAV